MTLRRNCPHDRYEEHPCIDGKWVSQARMMRITDDERTRLTLCPGGEFLPEDALVIEKVDGEWPEVALAALHATLERGTGDRFQPRFAASLLDALADQVGEPG